MEKQLAKFINDNIKAIRDVQLSNPNLLKEIQAYWKGQWDAFYRIAEEFKIKAKRRP